MKAKAFNHILNNNNSHVLIDFYAKWCAPCQTVTPIVEGVTRELSDSVSLIKVDIDSSRPIAEKFNIKSIPTLVLMKGNKIIWKKTGYVTKKELRNQLVKSIN